MLHDRQGDAEDVCFLERIGPDGRTGNLTGDHHHRHRIHLGGGDPGHEIGGTWPRRPEADSTLPVARA